MITTMDRLELKFYKELGIHERINDKQDQLEHLARMSAWDNMEMPEYARIMPRSVRTALNYFTKELARKPY